MEDREEEKAKGSERWRAATGNLMEMAANLDSLQKLLVKKAVYVDQETFVKASLSSEQARTIKAFEQRVETLERELDSAISAAAHALALRKDRPRQLKKLPNFMPKRLQRSWRTPQRYLNSTWKSCVQNKKRFLSEIMK
ncbi:hypothetical protein Acr_06g0013370 [Actinidia rufa]|uniref:Uncharacterized protein n=1 Tax=Actinidia rufa TaxID=165716 RepID=A0A7J0EUY6_9ERIC|nr:hypothetical protein Acr_06g0013370 [Actinidia rufa]